VFNASELLVDGLNQGSNGFVAVIGLLRINAEQAN